MGLILQNIANKGGFSLSGVNGRFSANAPEGGSSIITDGLTIQLDAPNPTSYPGTGTTWFDLSGNGNNGTLNGPTFVNSSIKSFLFDSNDDYVQLPYVVNTNNNWTLTFKSKANSSFGYYTLFSTIDGPGHLQIRYTPTGTIQLLRNQVALVGEFTSHTETINVFSDITITKSSSTYKLYINGIYKNEFSNAASFTTGPQTLGKSTNGETLNGNINSFIAYNRALSEVEITQNYNATKGAIGL